MPFHKNTAFLSFVILTISLLLIPGQAYSFNDLTIFYSNDVSGHTDPCG